MSSYVYKSKLLFLYYKALHLNSDYQNFCRHMNGSGEGLIRNLIEKYDNIIPLYTLFGDLTSHYDNVNEPVNYKKWLKNNSYKFIETSFSRHEIIVEGNPITPKAGVVYFTIPKHAPAEILGHFFNASMWRSVEQLNYHMKKWFMPVKQTNWLSNSKVQSTSKRLDVYYWAVYKPNLIGIKEPSNRSVMNEAYYSGKSHWRVLKSALDGIMKTTLKEGKLVSSVEELPATSINSNTGHIRILRQESIHLVNNALLGFFPSPIENDTNAPILFGSMKGAIESGDILS